MKGMNSSAADKAVIHDTGWINDGHHICWNGSNGAFMGHPDNCPFYIENKLRVYVCSPGCYAISSGITLSDLPEDEAAACREFNHGSEPIHWRLHEVIHPNLSINAQTNLSRFEIRLDHEDSRND